MSRNYQRQLALLDMPAGDLRAFKKEGGKIRLYDMGGSPSTPEKTTTTVELPEWARGYAKDTLAKGSALTDINQNPYQQYGGERIAGFQPMQQQAFEGAAGMQPSQQVGLGSGIAGAWQVWVRLAQITKANFRGGQFNDQAAQDYMIHTPRMWWITRKLRLCGTFKLPNRCVRLKLYNKVRLVVAGLQSWMLKHSVH
jgi:hypothetical protein